MTQHRDVTDAQIQKGMAHMALVNAIKALDERTIRLYFAGRAPQDDMEFWGGVHRTRLNMSDATQAQKDESLAWLMKHSHLPQVANPPDRG